MAHRVGEAGVPGWVIRTGVASWMGVGVILLGASIVFAAAFTKALVLPILFAAVFTALAMPAVDRLEQRGLKRSLGAALALLAVGALVTSTAWIFGAGIASQAGEIEAELRQAVERIRSLIVGLNIDGDLVDRTEQSVIAAGPAFRDGILRPVVEGLSGLVSLGAGLVIGAFTLFYLLRDGRRFGTWAQQQLDPAKRDELAALGHHAAKSIRQYFFGQSIVGSVNAVVIAGGAALLGTPLVPSIFILTFAGGYIPYVGTFLAGSFAVLLTLAQGGFGAAGILLGVMLVTQSVIEPFVEARAVGSSLGLHPLVVFLSTTLGGILAGIPGLILAAPITAIAIFSVGKLRSSGFFR